MKNLKTYENFKLNENFRLNIKSLNDMLNSEEYQNFESDTLLNIQYHIINNPSKNIDNMIAANEEGEFGCTHGEFIDCWRDYLNTLNVFDADFEEDEYKKKYDIDKETYDKISREIDKVEEYHDEKGTLNDYI